MDNCIGFLQILYSTLSEVGIMFVGLVHKPMLHTKIQDFKVEGEIKTRAGVDPGILKGVSKSRSPEHFAKKGVFLIPC